MSTEGMSRVGAAPVGEPDNGDETSGDWPDSLSVSFPVDNYAATVARVTVKVLRVCAEIAGRGSATSPTNTYRTIVDMVRCDRRGFSGDCELPGGEPRDPTLETAPR